MERAGGHSSSGGSDFLSPSDLGSGELTCDVWSQNCPDGFKCMPYALTGAMWTDTRCSPLAEQPAQTGEACQVFDAMGSGVDDCDLSSMCWQVDAVTLTGTCFPFCVGQPTAPRCENTERYCSQTSAGLVNLCHPACNPIVQDCPEGQGCYPEASTFACISDGTGQYGNRDEWCNLSHHCSAGLSCVSHYERACPGGPPGCCRPFCEVGTSGPPCSPLDECAPWFEDALAPAGLEDVGLCLPPDL